jgi:allophanate hydrolase subunit 1
MKTIASLLLNADDLDISMLESLIRGYEKIKTHLKRNSINKNRIQGILDRLNEKREEKESEFKDYIKIYELDTDYFAKAGFKHLVE